jgi:hypothetical protein
MIIKADLINPALKPKSLIDENDQLIAIFVSSVRTAKNNKG